MTKTAALKVAVVAVLVLGLAGCGGGGTQQNPGGSSGTIQGSAK